MATNFGGFTLGAIAGCHCWGAIAGCHCWVLATNFGGVHVGCHCWVPLLGCHCWGAIAGVPLLGALRRAVARKKSPECYTVLRCTFLYIDNTHTHTNWLVLSGVYAGII